MSSLYTWYPKFLWQLENGEDLDETRDIDSTETSCNELKEAMEGFGTDEGALIETLGSKTPRERYFIIQSYADMFEGESLVDEINDETSGDFGRALKYLALIPSEAEAKMIHNTLHKGYDKKHLIPILVGRSNPDLTLIKKAYFKMFDVDMIVDLSDKLDGDYKKLMVMCAQGIEENFDPEEVHTEDKVNEDVDAFYEAGQGSWGTDESVFFKILVASPIEHLKAVNDAYAEKYDVTMKREVKKETGGECEDALVYLFGRKLEKCPETIAAEIKACTKGWGCDENGLMNLIIRLSFFPALFDAVREAHENEYEKTIEDRIESELGGNLKKLLLLVMENCRD